MRGLIENNNIKKYFKNIQLSTFENLNLIKILPIE